MNGIKPTPEITFSWGMPSIVDFFITFKRTVNSLAVFFLPYHHDTAALPFISHLHYLEPTKTHNHVHLT